VRARLAAAVLLSLLAIACTDEAAKPETNAQLEDDLAHAGNTLGDHDKRLKELEAKTDDLQAQVSRLKERLHEDDGITR
jgi:septal ring factor EnvC (AmiA/AmiB activator)